MYLFMAPPLSVFYDEQGNETEMVLMKAGSETSGVWIEQGRYHSLEATDEMGWCLRQKRIDITQIRLNRYYSNFPAP